MISPALTKNTKAKKKKTQKKTKNKKNTHKKKPIGKYCKKKEVRVLGCT